MAVAYSFDGTLTDVRTGEQVRFYQTHTRLPSREGMEEQSWRLLRGGLVRQSREGGQQPTEHTLTAWFPGGREYGEPWAPAELWRPPLDLMYQLRAWMRNRTELRYLFTETDIDSNVYIASIDKEWGELDRLHFSLSLIELRTMWVEVIPAAEAQAEGGEQRSRVGGGRSRGEWAFRMRRAGEPPAPIPDQFTVTRDGMSLAHVAALCYGTGSPNGWSTIAEANPETLAGIDTQNLPLGLRLTVPGGQHTETVVPRQRSAPPRL